MFCARNGRSAAAKDGRLTSAARCLSVFHFCVDLPLHFHLSGCLEEGLEALLKATGSNLLILKISHCPNLLTDRSLWLASCYCRALQAVTYRYPQVPYVAFHRDLALISQYLDILHSVVYSIDIVSHVWNINCAHTCCVPGVPRIQLAKR